MNNLNKIDDKEFVLLAMIKGDIASAIHHFCKVHEMNIKLYPDFKGNVVWLVKEESLYHIEFLIRYLSESSVFNLSDCISQICYSYEDEIVNQHFIIKDNGELSIVIDINRK